MRSKLFVPASRPELFAKALASAADAISFDLEDAVAPERKAMARAALNDLLRGDGPQAPLRVAPAHQSLIVRVNAVGSEHFEADLQAIVWPALDVINLPMVEGPETVQRAAEQIEQLQQARAIAKPIRLLVNIESPRGLRKAAELALAHPTVMGLQIGYGDLFAPLGIASGEPSATQYVRTAVRLAAGEAGIAAYDGAYVNFKDTEGYRRDSMAARALGFAGRSCIHPSQIDLANQVFMPTPAELEQALKVVRACEQNLAAGVGAFSVDGRLVDGPFITEAQALVALGRRLGLLD
ncbi:MAG: CoA ester lyase [Betaproteobacteria bacterium]